MYRHHPQWQRAKEIVATGGVGELRTIQSFFSYFNDDPHNIRNQLELGGSRISGPLLDRLDLQVEVPSIDPRRFRLDPEHSWSTATLRARVLGAVEQQRRRSRTAGGWIPNGRLQGKDLERAVGCDETVHRTLERILELHHLSGRSRIRLLRIARTVADLDQCENLRPEHILEAARLRGFAQHPVD